VPAKQRGHRSEICHRLPDRSGAHACMKLLIAALDRSPPFIERARSTCDSSLRRGSDQVAFLARSVLSRRSSPPGHVRRSMIWIASSSIPSLANRRERPAVCSELPLVPRRAEPNDAATMRDEVERPAVVPTLSRARPGTFYRRIRKPSISLSRSLTLCERRAPLADDVSRLPYNEAALLET
jgi:hypothetical protein